ncbi:MAG: RtcB family protein [Desulfovibrionales bacterium]|nr:RtcB family protein [Desulfovibrionales bacterium]
MYEVRDMEIKSLKKINDFLWELPSFGEMRVPGLIFASQTLVEEMDEKVREQVTNVACLPGIVHASIAMPDAHWGYGFPIGGVAAFDPEEGGIISAGGVGFDISCGVRTLTTGLIKDEIMPSLERLIDKIFQVVPAGVGSEGKIRLTPAQIDDVLAGGAKWALDRGYGLPEDLEYIEEGGYVAWADPAQVSDLAKKRQFREVGTLGSGNHYLEIQHVFEIYDAEAAEALGIKKDDIVIAIHCGSRALGHQIGTDYLVALAQASKKYNIPIRERELVCAPINSPEGKRYFGAVGAGINCALANRQVISHLTREAVAEIIPQAKLKMLFDVSHNTCKVEEHVIAGKKRRLYVHRKGSTRAFGPGRPEIPARFRSIGQPVFIGGTMGTCSFILVGTEFGTEQAFGSACHGAGRSMSRKRATKTWRGDKIIKDLSAKGIIIRTRSYRGVAEEAPGAYKDVVEVVNAAHQAGLAKKVAMVKPLACVKG